MSIARRGGALAAGLVLGLIVAGVSAAQTEEVVPEAPGAVTQDGRLAEAERLFSLAELEAARPFLDEVVDEGLRAVAGDPAMPRAGLARALDLRAQVAFMLGETEAANRDLVALVEVEPAYAFDATRVSPRLLEAHAGVARERVGSLTVTGTPEDATVLVDGRPVGRAPFEAVAALAGERELRIERTGFDAARQTITIEPGQDMPFEYELFPNARTLVIRTEPAEVTVSLDGDTVGVTETGVPLVLEAVPPGERRLVFERPCFVTVERMVDVTVDLADNAPLDLEPVELRRSSTSLDLRTHPEGAEVRIDGAPAGRAPLTAPVCPGDHAIEVFVRGRRVWFEERTFGVDEQARMEAWPRPTLVVQVDRELARTIDDEDLAPLFASGDRGGGFNRLVPARELSTGVPGRIAEDLEALGADLLLELRQGDDPVRREIVAALHSPESPEPDVVRLPERDAAALEAFIASLAEPRRWLVADAGLLVFDAADGPPRVGPLDPSGAAAGAGLRAGDRITSIAGEPLRFAGDIGTVVRAVQPGGSLQVGLTRGSTPVEASVETVAAIDVPPPRAAGVSHALLLARASADAVMATTPLEQAAISLGRASALMHGEAWAEALAAAREVPARIEEDPSGHAAATARFFEAVCLESLGYPQDAAKAYAAAAGYPQARHGGPGGMPLALVAELRAERLSR